MDLPLFYAPGLETPDRNWVLDEEASRHAVRVLRLQPGEPLYLTDGQGVLALARIADAHPKRCRLKIESSELQPPRRPRRAVALAPTKQASRLEWFLEKATELGISEIFLANTERSERSQVKEQRLQHVLVSAMLQSRQTYLPKLHAPQPLAALLEHPDYPCRMLAWCGPMEKPHLKDLLQPDQPALVLIGPEGDFSQSEAAAALKAGCFIVSLGATRLRVETAALLSAVLLTLDQQA